MAKRQRGWTTLTDIEEFKTITWSFLKNITMTWEYDGMAFLFREARIPIYGIDRGTMKMNHPIMAMGIPMQRDKNYGVDIYVPAKLKKKAASLLADEARVRECAELEIVAGEENARAFNEEALANKKRNSQRKAERRKSFFRTLLCKERSEIKKSQKKKG